MGNGVAVRHIQQYTETRGQLHALAASPPLKDSPNPMGRKLVGLQNWPGRGGEDKNLFLGRQTRGIPESSITSTSHFT